MKRWVRAADFVRNHCKPGDRFTDRAGQEWIVGHVNGIGGICDDCKIEGAVKSDCKPDCCDKAPK